MNILLLGSGGRENAFAWKIAGSEYCNQLFIAPGNAGTSAYGKNIAVNPNDFAAVKKIVLDNDIEMVVVGPEEPLVNGIHDFFLADRALEDVAVIGPQKEGARLEGSKDFSKAFMQKYGIPTAGYKTFTVDQLQAGLEYVQNHTLPIVLKADGLAAGKGVIICNDENEVNETVRDLTENKIFGEAGLNFVVEQFLTGNEVSLFAICDGEDYVLLPPAQDYKRVFEEDKGKNTGGMGSYSPANKFCNAEVLSKIEEQIIKPVLSAMKNEGREYKGCLFCGLMITENKEPYVIEFNCRFGDPETQSVLTLIESDFLELLIASAEGNIKNYDLKIKNAYAGCVVLASLGYPDEYQTGKLIEGLADVPDNILVFHAGTSEREGKIYTHGGRVLSVVSLSEKSFNSAFDNIYSAIEKIDFENKYFRRDIGKIVL